MSTESDKCPTCDTPSSAWLDGNCPICLMQLGTPAHREHGSTKSGDKGEARKRQESAFIGRRIGDYELVDELARGGMGIVYRARQISLNRMVAVKVLLAGHFANDTFIKRFRREAEAAASLSHPNIVSIHEVGEHEGQPYFSMELIEGRSLADLTREKPVPAREAAQLVKTIAEAVHFAHGRGLLHRDLKPSNVLVDASNVPHITDFGLVKRVEDADLTVTGQVLGTPNYMPPEQADPKRGPATVGSDVYSLGAILYHLVAGRPPFMAETLTQTLRLVTDTEAVSPRILNPGMPRDLETICAKCLEKEPQCRYASTQELAEELGRFLEDEPIRARPVSLPAKLMRWCRRKPALASAIGAGVALLMVIAIGSPIAIIRINAAREQAEAAREQEAGLRARAESAERETQDQLYTALVEQARATVLSGEMGHRVRALDAIKRAAAISNAAELRREVFAALALPDLRFEREIAFASDVTYLQLDPMLERVAVGTGKGPVEIRAMSDNRLLMSLAASTNLPSYVREWSPDGRFLAVKRDYPGSQAGELEVWDVARGQRVLLLNGLSHAAFSFHPRLPRILVGRRTEGVALWNLEGRELMRFPQVNRASLLRFSPEGERFASVSPRNPGLIVSVHDASNPDSSELAVSRIFTNNITTFAWHPGGRWLAVPDHGTSVHWMDGQTGETGLIGRHKHNAVRTVFTPDGAYLFTGGWERELICWNGRTRRRELTISLDSHTIQVSADGRRCAVIAESGGVQLHTFERPAAHREFEEDLGGLLLFRQATFSDDGRWLAASGDKNVGVWDLAAGGPAAISDKGSNTRLYFTPDAREVFATRNSHGSPACFRWGITPASDSTQPPVLTRLPLHKPRGFTHLCLSSTNVVMTGTNGSQLLAPAELELGGKRWAPTHSGINGVSPDGRWLGVYRSFGTSLYVYRLPGFERVAKLTQSTAFGDFEFSPSGDELAISSLRSSTRVELWDTAKWERTRTLTNFGRLLYAPDKSGLWLTKNQRNAGLYDAQTLDPVLLLPTGMLPLALSPDGNRVAVSVDGQRLQVWDLVALREQFRELGLDWKTEFSKLSN